MIAQSPISSAGYFLIFFSVKNSNATTEKFSKHYLNQQTAINPFNICLLCLRQCTDKDTSFLWFSCRNA